MIREPHYLTQTGGPHPLGANWDGRGVNFALFSAHAEKVELCLFDESGTRETRRIPLPDYTHQVWHGYFRDIRPGQLYGYRVYGPYDPKNGHRFNHHKLLIDPYAKLLHGPLRWHDALYGFTFGSPLGDLSFDVRDSAAYLPKCVVVDDAFTWGDERRPKTPWPETVLYELHVRGFSMRAQNLPPELRGSFAGLGQADTLHYLQQLGVTAIELLPIQAFVDDRPLSDRGLRNYWGYMPLAFFAPENRYLASGQLASGQLASGQLASGQLASGQLAEFKAMVRSCHDAGIEVIIDVVYNHTCESGRLGPTLSFRGIDNASYYRLDGSDRRKYIDFTGCGNTFDLSQPRVLQLVMDSLRYWVTQMGVDGFRFDLAASLGRGASEFSAQQPFFHAIGQDPVLAGVKLIAEPWDIGPGGYQLGNFPPGWAELNDRSRDSVRRFWRGDQGTLPNLAKTLQGSSDKFEYLGRKPWASINYLTNHDGFTLADLVSYKEKHNEANQEGNKDGNPNNQSENYGVEGPSDNSELRELRQRQRRNMLTTTLLSQGTPFLLAGDEFGRSQGGNNNPYCQDNDLSWLQWDKIPPEEHEFRDFVRRVLRLRRDHRALRRTYFLHGESRSARTGLLDIQWMGPNGQPVDWQYWEQPDNKTLGLVLAGDALPKSPHSVTHRDATLLILFHAGLDTISFRLPSPQAARHWHSQLDTAHPKSPAGHLVVQVGQTIVVEPRSLLIFQLI